MNRSRERLRTSMLALMAALCCAGRANAAQDPDTIEAPDTVRQAEGGVVFDFQNADLRVVITALAEVAGTNIVYSSLPDRSVTLRTTRPVPPSEARRMLESIVRGNGLELRDEDGLVRIVAPPPDDRAAAEPGTRIAPTGAGERRLFVYHLKHARADAIVQTLGELFGLGSGMGFAAAEAGPGSLSESLREQTMAPYREMAQAVDRETAGGNAGGGQARAQGGGARERQAEEGMGAGLHAPVDLVADPLTNSILMLATPADHEILLGAIQELDVRPLQVMIEVLIAEVRHNDELALGVDIDVPLEEGEESGVTFRLQGLSTGDVAVGVLGIGDMDATVVLRALANRADVRILSRPVILAHNNQQARILVGDQRPFVQLFRALPTDAAVRDQVVQYRNVGTQLLIRPTINDDGYVTLSVLQEVSNATTETQFGAPVINTREAETELLVKDGQTIVLGGLIDRQTERSHSGIPVLKDLPLLGALFRSSRTRTIANELLLLLTPHVLRSDQDVDEMRRELEGEMERLGGDIPPPFGADARDAARDTTSASSTEPADSLSSRVEPRDSATRESVPRDPVPQLDR